MLNCQPCWIVDAGTGCGRQAHQWAAGFHPLALGADPGLALPPLS